MSPSDITGTDWTGEEVDLIVADYFDMLAAELAGKSYVKSRRNEALQRLIGRSRGSIEFKHQNISAVLLQLGLPWIVGYKPMANFQNALIQGVGRYLGSWDQSTFVPDETTISSVEEEGDLWIGPPPTPNQEEEASLPETLRWLVRKFDPAERDARNRKLGKSGEAIVFEHERRHLIAAGRVDLAKRLRWTSQEDGDGAGYDIHSFDLSGKDRLIEVKTTVGHALTPFFITENERAFSVERQDAFRLVRLYDFARKPAAFEIAPPLSDYFKLSPTLYRAALTQIGV